MARSYASTVINAAADDVWARVRDFNGLPTWAGPAIEKSELEGGLAGDQVGIPLVADLDLDGRGQYVHSSLSPSRNQRRARSLAGMTTPEGHPPAGFSEYRQHPRRYSRGNRG